MRTERAVRGADLARWPESASELATLQNKLAAAQPPAWQPSDPAAIGGCFVCFGKGGAGPGARGDQGWAGAAVLKGGGLVASATVRGPAGAPYQSGLLALREGPLLERAVRSLGAAPDLLVVNATGRDHPRRAGLALQLGAVLSVPTVGATHRPLLASGEWPSEAKGTRSPLMIDEEVVGFWVRTRHSARPLAVHAGWRTDPEQAAEIAMACVGRFRTPEPIRHARRLARRARSER